MADSIVKQITLPDNSEHQIGAKYDINNKEITKEYAKKAENAFYIVGSGTTDSSAKTSTWTGTHSDIKEYYDGLTIKYKIAVAGQTTTTLNINNFGAKRIYRYGSATLTTQFPVGSIINLVYHADLNSGCWMCNDYDSNTTYTNVKLGHGYATCETAAATTAKTASLSSYTLTTGGIVVVKFVNAVPANATLNINSKGAKGIQYRDAAITAGVIKAGDTVTFMYNGNYEVLSIDRWQKELDWLGMSYNASTDTVTFE